MRSSFKNEKAKRRGSAGRSPTECGITCATLTRDTSPPHNAEIKGRREGAEPLLRVEDLHVGQLHRSIAKYPAARRRTSLCNLCNNMSSLFLTLFHGISAYSETSTWSIASIIQLYHCATMLRRRAGGALASGQRESGAANAPRIFGEGTDT